MQVDPKLISYVQDTLKQGYSVSAIREVLERQEYSSQTVSEVLSQVQQGGSQPASSASKGVLLLVPLLVVLLGVAAFWVFSGSSALEISDGDLSTGAVIGLQEQQRVAFFVQEQPHSLTIEAVTSDSVSVLVQSNPVRVDLLLGEEKRVVLYEDGFYDLMLRLDRVEGAASNIYIRSIRESTCVAQWECGDWGVCSEDGVASRECRDVNSCGFEDEEPALTQSCDYVASCVPDWECGDWGVCSEDGVASRECRDVNSCGFEDEEPALTQSCEFVQIPSIDSQEITLDIFFEQDSYEVGQEVHPEYYLRYDAEPFNGLLIYCTPSTCLRSSGLLEDIEFSDSEKTNSLQVTLSDTFSSPGSYEYSVHLFSCEEVDDVLQTTSCGAYEPGTPVSFDDIKQEVTPLRVAQETVLVTSAEPVLECSENQDCAQGLVCENNACVEDLTEDDTAQVTNPETILDCYTESLDEIICSAETAMSFTTNFESRLAACESSQGTFALGFEPILGLFRGYDIQGEQDEVCSVRFWFLDTSILEPSLAGKEMVCEYDSTQRTLNIVNECLECCTGELADEINNLDW